MSTSITLNHIHERMAEGVPLGQLDEPSVRRLWWGALEVLQQEILLPMDLSHGLWLASPLPALYEPRLLDRLQGWVWAPEELSTLHRPHRGLLPPNCVSAIQPNESSEVGSYKRLPLRKEDGYDPLLIIITPHIQIALALQGEIGQRNLIMRSDLETFKDLLGLLDLRLNAEEPTHARQLRQALANLGALSTHETIQEAFWPLLSARLASSAPSLTVQTLPDEQHPTKTSKEPSAEITLLQALTHEVRTPLATIRTLIRSLLRRNDLSQLVINRLKQIDSECTEQIDRFGLIFNAAELQRQQPEVSRLASTDLGQMLELLYPTWNEQLERRGLNLNLNITPDLPHVLSDPERLELMLRGLIDRNSRGLKPGSTLLLALSPAGHRLKLQILTNTKESAESEQRGAAQNSDLGPVLSWNPSTGSLQLSQAATQRLLASLGGRLTHRRDSGLTVFFPIAEVQ